MDLATLDCNFACGKCGKPMHASEGVHDDVTQFIVHDDCLTVVAVDEQD